MASLRNIMNDEDEADPYPPAKSTRRGSGSYPGTERSSMPGSSYNMPPEYPGHSVSSSTSRHSGMRTPPSYGRHPQPAEPALRYGPGPPPGMPDRPGGMPRGEPIEPQYPHHHGYGHGYAGQYSAPYAAPYQSGPSRQLGSPGAEVPVKFTPITGRVSRAKKGVPVHICEVCAPPKTFTRAEHLRRHQLSHQPPALPCNVAGCDKVFHRRDLLERHQQRHEQEDSSSRTSLGPSSNRSHSSDSRQATYPGSPPDSESHTQERGDGSPAGSPASTGADSRSAMGSESSHWTTDAGRPLSIPVQSASDETPVGGISSDYTTGREPYQTMVSPNMSQPRAFKHAAPSLYSPTPATPTASGVPDSAEYSGDGMTMVSTAACCAPMRLGRPAPEMAIYSSRLSLQRAYNMSNPLPVPAKRKLAPQAAVVEAPGSCGEFPTPESRFMDLVPRAANLGSRMSLTARDIPQTTLAPDIRSAVPSYIDIYWEKVHPLYPIIHRATAEDEFKADGEFADVLQCAMAAVASQFLGHMEHRVNGSQLHAYAWQKSYMSLQSTEWPLSVMQAVLLCEYYARFRGRSREDYRPSPRFQALAKLVAKSVSIAGTQDPPNQSWGSWISDESRRRLHAACFLLSVHSAAYYEQPCTEEVGVDNWTPQVPHIPLSGSTSRLWAAPTASAWMALNPSRATRTTIGEVMMNRLATDMETLPLFDSSLLLAAHVLGLRQTHCPKHELTALDEQAKQSKEVATISTLFARSPAANAYLALHYTPLHALLAVAGDSWVFNKKLPSASVFADMKHRLSEWRSSNAASSAVAFASRALRDFLGLQDGMDQLVLHRGHTDCKDISDFWGIYVCTLICWAFGHVGKRAYVTGPPSPSERATNWILATAQTEPGELQKHREAASEGSQAVVSLVWDLLDGDCLGGRNILFADAVGVLRKLDEVGNWSWF